MNYNHLDSIKSPCGSILVTVSTAAPWQRLSSRGPLLADVINNESSVWGPVFTGNTMKRTFISSFNYHLIQSNIITTLIIAAVCLKFTCMSDRLRYCINKKQTDGQTNGKLILIWLKLIIELIHQTISQKTQQQTETRTKEIFYQS